MRDRWPEFVKLIIFEIGEGTMAQAREKSVSRRAKRKSEKASVSRQVALIDGHCSMPQIPPRTLDPDILPGRERLIRITSKKWVNNTILHYCFLDSPAIWRGSEDDKQAVRDAFQTWKDLPIGLEFREVHDARQAEVRIGFDQNDGSWSYVGRDSIDFAPDPAERTMNFGWPLTTPYGRDTALHEIGHLLGFPHSQANPNAGIVWDEPAVLDYFSGHPNYWSHQTTRRNVLRKLPATEVEGSDWDPNSIMQYSFPAGLILEPDEYRTEPLIPDPGLSQTDIDTAKQFYPAPETPRVPELRPYEAHRIRLEPGQQLDFEIRPQISRNYTLQTFGRMDTVMVLFEEIDGEPRYMNGDDDSGWNQNARITDRLVEGRRYFLRLRLYYAQASGEGALMMY